MDEKEKITRQFQTLTQSSPPLPPFHSPRDFFPGQPFKAQQCAGEDADGNCNDLPICTPGFKGSASTPSYVLALALSGIFSFVAWLLTSF